MKDYVRGGYYPFLPWPQAGSDAATGVYADQLVTWPCEVFEDVFVDQVVFGPQYGATYPGETMQVALWEPDATTGLPNGDPAVTFPVIDLSAYGSVDPWLTFAFAFIQFDPILIPAGVYRTGLLSTVDIGLLGLREHEDYEFGGAVANDEGKGYPTSDAHYTVWRWTANGVTSLTLTGAETWVGELGIGELGAGPRPPLIFFRVIPLLPPPFTAGGLRPSVQTHGVPGGIIIP